MLAGQFLTRARVEELVGDVGQLGAAVPAELTDGAGRGCRIITVRSAHGLSFDVLVDRALDLGWAAAAGLPLAWRSPQGLGAVRPATGDPDSAWSRSFGGGLLTTCGLRSVGRASTDSGERFGLHGSVFGLAGQDLRVHGHWQGDDYLLEVSGRVVETSLSGPTLELQRTVRTAVGSSSVEVDDVVTNIGTVPTPTMVRHHINLGFPLLRCGDRIAVDAEPPRSRDPVRADALRDWAKVASVTADTDEQVFTARVRAQDGWAHAALLDGATGTPKLSVAWTADSMPLLVLWKHQRAHVNALALEPSTHDDAGREAARRQGTLTDLPPAGSQRYTTRITVHPGAHDRRRPSEGTST